MRALNTFLGAFAMTFAVAVHSNAQSNAAAAVAIFDEGRSAMQKGDFETACEKFKESNRIDPAVGTSFNLANCEERRGRLATAWVLFKQVAGRMKPDDPRLAVAASRIASLDKRVPRVTLTTNGTRYPGLRVRIDDLDLDAAGFDTALPLDPGTHQAVARSPRKVTRSRQFSLAEGEALSLSIEELVAVDAPGPSPSNRVEKSEDRVAGLKRPDAVLGAAIVGGVGLLTGAVTGLVGLNAQKVGDAECSTETRTCSQKGFDANQRAKSLAIVSTVGFGLAILGGATATYLFITAPTSSTSNQPATVSLRGTW